MRLAGLSWRAFLGICLLVLVSFTASFGLLAAQLRDTRNEGLDQALLAHARVLRLALRHGWEARETDLLERTLNALVADGTAVVIARPTGETLLDTANIYGAAGVRVGSPEANRALRNGTVITSRKGIQRATPSRIVIERADTTTGDSLVIWLAKPAWRLQNDWGAFREVLLALGVFAAGTVVALGFALTYRWTRLLRTISRAARSLSQGDLSVRAEVLGSDEWATLARSLNETRRRILADAETIDRQRRTLEALLTQLGEGVIVVRADGRIALINPAAERLLNIDPGPANSCVGRTFEECVPQHELQKLLEAAQSASRSPVPHSAEQASLAVEEARLQIEAPAGTLHVLARISELMLPERAKTGGGSVGWVLVVTDITELGRALQMQTDFVGNASHELRTPLSTIRAAVETLVQMDLTKEAEDAGHFLGIVDRQSDRLSAMVSDLLHLSRLDSASTALEPGRYRLTEIARGVEDRFDEVVKAKGLDWEVAYVPGHDATVVVTLHLLRLALDNVVDNAIKFTPPGGRVRLTCRLEAGRASFEVSDTGCGIPENDRSRVFERFYQVERARSGSERGTGLGLSIVQQTIAAVGGTVTLESEVGAGTRVTLSLPTPAGEGEPTPVPAVDGAEPPHEAPGKTTPR